VEPKQPAPDQPEQESLHEEIHLPPPTLWPLGFAIGIVVVLVGLVVNPVVISAIGGGIAIIFGAFVGGMLATSGYVYHQPTPLRVGSLIGAVLGGLMFTYLYHLVARKGI